MFSRNEEQRFEKLENFELNNRLLKLAKKNEKLKIFLNAGRGNPNWINIKARLAFNCLIEFGIQESQRTINNKDLAGFTKSVGLARRFEKFLANNPDQAKRFLLKCLNYFVHDCHFDVDEVVKEFTDGALGNNYPVPNRCLHFSEKIVNKYLEAVLYNGEKLAEKTNLFATEGGTAAICYIFNSLSENKLLKKGDKIAINTPIFSPYLQIPQLNDYELVEVALNSKEENNWEIASEEIDKLKDTEIKAFFIVNPTNPAAKAFTEKALLEIQKVVAQNPNLMIITDDVYGTFVKDFKSVYALAPHNTLLVYSFSKLFGATGWRLGVIAAHEDNVFDRLLSNISPKDKEILDKRLAWISLSPEKMNFIDRLLADSRSVGLAHTGGLSTPQQIMAALFSLTYLTEPKNNEYLINAHKLVSERSEKLHKTLGIAEDESKENSKYYSLIDIYKLAEEKYDQKFRKYLENHFEEVDFLLNLAEKNGVILMDGVGFGTTPGIIRVSQANLPTTDYAVIGKQILALLAEYYDDYLKSIK